MPRTLASSRSLATNRVSVQNFPCSLGFNGASSKVKIASVFGATLANPYSIEFWFKASPQTTNAGLYSAGNSSTATQFMRIASDSGSGKGIRFQIVNDAGTTIVSQNTTKQYFDNNWHHLVLVDNLGTVTLYMDNVVDPTNLSYTPSGTLTLNQIALGCLTRNIDGNFSLGEIVGFNTYNIALTAAQVNIRYNGKAIISPTLTWPLTEGAGTTAYDTSGNANNGTITSGTYTADVPSRTRNLVGGNLVYNGNFEFAPPINVAQTSPNQIDGTSGGSGTNFNFGYLYKQIFSGSGTVMFDRSQAHSGSYSLKISTTATGSEIQSSTQTSVSNPYILKVLPSTAYTVTFWLKTQVNSGSAATGASFGVQERSGTGGAGSVHSATGINTTTPWTQYTLSFTTASTTQYASLFQTLQGNDGTATLIMDAWYDDIQLYPTVNTTRSLAT